MLQKRVTKPLHSPKPIPTLPLWLLPFMGPVVLILFLLFGPCLFNLFQRFLQERIRAVSSLEIRSRPFFFSRALPQAQKMETVGPRTILHSRPKTVAPIQQEVAREIRHPFFPCFMISGSGMKESFGPREENSSLKGPLLNHLTSERTKHNFSYILMLQASCIYLGLNSPCPETYHPLHPTIRLITTCPTTIVISTDEYSNPS